MLYVWREELEGLAGLFGLLLEYVWTEDHAAEFRVKLACEGDSLHPILAESLADNGIVWKRKDNKHGKKIMLMQCDRPLSQPIRYSQSHHFTIHSFTPDQTTASLSWHSSDLSLQSLADPESKKRQGVLSFSFKN